MPLTTVYYYIVSEPPASLVEIEVDSSKAINLLVEAILAENRQQFNPSYVRVHQLPLDLFKEEEEDVRILNGVKKYIESNECRMWPLRSIASYCGGSDNATLCVALVPVAPPYIVGVREAIIKSAATRKNPSTGAVVSEVIATQTTGRPDEIFNRRPGHLWQPPVDIWSPLFSGLRRVLSQSLDDVRFAPKELAQANVILQAALAHYPNKSERQGVLSTIPFGGRLPFSRETISANGHSYSPDGAKFVVWESAPLHSLSVVYCIEEIENDLGAGSSDPIRQAECHYAAVCSGYEYAQLREMCCLPMVLIGLSGESLQISGAVFADAIICEPLVKIFLSSITNVGAPSRSDYATTVRQVALVSRALSNCLDGLQDFYQSLPPHTPLINHLDVIHPPWAPHFKKFSHGGANMELEYLVRLEPDFHRKAVFKARLKNDSSTLVIVKFAHTYNKQAHQLLEKELLAPKLWLCEQVREVGDLHVVIMDYVEEHSEEITGNIAAIEALRQAIRRLHDADFVHGDLREPNVLVKKNSVMLIDFDWCDKEGKARYPADILLDAAHGWHKDVNYDVDIKKEHDAHMFKRMTREELVKDV